MQLLGREEALSERLNGLLLELARLGHKPDIGKRDLLLHKDDVLRLDVTMAYGEHFETGERTKDSAQDAADL